jgi:hypothetical protein
VAAISAIPLIDALLCDFLVLDRRGLVSACVVDSCVNVAADSFACAVDHAHALSDGVSKSHVDSVWDGFVNVGEMMC